VISWSPLAGGWLSGRYRQDADQQAPFSAARRRLAERFDLSLPANQRKLEAAEALARLAEEAGMSLIELAIAFVLNHPAVTAAIIGPRTTEQLESQLPGRRRRPRSGAAGPHRRARPARHQPQPGRRRVGQPGPAAGRAAALEVAAPEDGPRLTC
jgi:hypothetical protein